MKLSYILIVLTFISQHVYAQKVNPIIYDEFGFGASFGKAPGLLLFNELNYQKNDNLFSLRFSATIELTLKGEALAPFIIIPVFQQKSNSEELAVLYGKRLISKGHSFSFSLGLSANNFEQNRVDANGMVYKFQTNYIGVPYECNIKWFNRRKERLSVFYGYIPIGRPTAFGSSLGFKLSGNISNYSYGAISLTLGFGWHKQY